LQRPLLCNVVRPPRTAALFPYTTLFRSCMENLGQRRLAARKASCNGRSRRKEAGHRIRAPRDHDVRRGAGLGANRAMAHQAPLRSEEHTSELQSRENLVCRLLLEKKRTP